MAVLAITLSYAAEKTLISPDIAMKQFAGVYVNTEYSGEYVTKPQKLVITSGGRREEWSYAKEDEFPSGIREYKIAESWVDSRGNTYCTVDVNTGTGAKMQEL
jgi:hypothetical protein